MHSLVIVCLKQLHLNVKFISFSYLFSLNYETKTISYIMMYYIFYLLHNLIFLIYYFPYM